MRKKNKIEDVAEKTREALRKGLRKGWRFIKDFGQGFKGNLKNFGKGKGRSSRSVAKDKSSKQE